MVVRYINQEWANLVCSGLHPTFECPEFPSATVVMVELHAIVHVVACAIEARGLGDPPRLSPIPGELGAEGLVDAHQARKWLVRLRGELITPFERTPENAQAVLMEREQHVTTVIGVGQHAVWVLSESEIETISDGPLGGLRDEEALDAGLVLGPMSAAESAPEAHHDVNRLR